MRIVTADVCVIGAGLAGISAALAASETGLQVALLNDGVLCNGSSFSGTTWGLGMVCPKDDTPGAAEALIDDILAAGAGADNPDLVSHLVLGARPAIRWLEAHGAILDRIPAGHENDPQYIPCFGTQVHGWFGFEAAKSRSALIQQVKSSNIQLFEYTYLCSILQDEMGAVKGVVALQRADSPSNHSKLKDSVPELIQVNADATIMATGGYSALFASNLATPTSKGTGHILAHDAGAQLANLPFIQIMAAYQGKARLFVFNEKLWAHTELTSSQTGTSAFDLIGLDSTAACQALSAHALHGPFTSARQSQATEAAIAAATASGTCFAKTTLTPELESQPFVKTYVASLAKHGFDISRPLPIILAAQATNGGIVIDATGSTGVVGLYAAGEAAALYGADRLGGMASVGALVSGITAAQTVARAIRAHTNATPRTNPSATPTVPSSRPATPAPKPGATIAPANRPAFTLATPLSSEPVHHHAIATAQSLGTNLDRLLLGIRNPQALTTYAAVLQDALSTLATATPLTLQDLARLTPGDLLVMQKRSAIRNRLLMALMVLKQAAALKTSTGPHAVTQQTCC